MGGRVAPSLEVGLKVNLQDANYQRTAHRGGSKVENGTSQAPALQGLRAAVCQLYHGEHCCLSS